MRKSYDPITYWDSRSKSYNITEERNLQVDKETEFLISLYRVISAGRRLSLLDVGCGYGRLFNTFSKMKIPVKMFICDISKGFIEKASKDTKAPAIVWDGYSLPYKDKTFDVVVSFDVLLHVPPESLKVVWTELERVCNDYLFIATADNFRKDSTSSHCFNHNYESLMNKSDTFLLEGGKGGKTNRQD